MSAVASGLFKLVILGFAAVGIVALLLFGMLATPLPQPPELASISETARAADRAGLPNLDRIQARDGTFLARRHYPAAGPQLAIVIHGSSGSSVAVHALARALAARGVETYAIDIRGHGGSGQRGDIGYVGQLENDLADLVGDIRKTNAAAPITLIGHSSGGGFALRVAGSPIQHLFARTVLLAPYLGWNAPTSRPDAGGWAKADIPRILALVALRGIGITCCDSLPVLAFAVAPKSEKILTPIYTDRLMRNFAVSRDFRADLAAATGPITLVAGTDDELMFPEKYSDAVGNRAIVKLIDGVNHMGIVSDPRAVSAIADDVARAGASS